MALSQPPAEKIDQVYRRLLAGEPDAPSDLIGLLLEPLIAALRRAYPTTDPDLVSDVVTDSLLAFVQEPQRYQADKRSLWGYLKMDMRGDLLNRWRSLQRRSAREIALDVVALTLLDRNSDVEEAVVRRLAPVALPDGTDIATVAAWLRQDIPDDRDRHVVMLMVQGERRAVTYAAALGITDRPVAEQRRLVKQAKDRLRLRLKRRGVKIHER